jgi:hypothetical protein
MKSNPLKTVLEWVLVTSLLVSIVCFVQFLNRSRTLRTFQGEMVRYQSTHNMLNALLADCVEYSKRNPAINPILESVGVKQGPATPATSTAKPAGK